ncbi:hypothetical protein F5Y05DRAFT_203989 [Hypoxylon sp. FL0543]|nr:hypothetical protein F5Y05DRAFT_203989 [Hypoxylon sp. FL0543]
MERKTGTSHQKGTRSLVGGIREDNDINGRSPQPHRIYVVTAKDSAALKSRAKRLASYIRNTLNDHRLGDLAYTLSERRSRLPAVVAIRAENADELANRLEQISSNVSNATSERPRLGFVFNGQDAQWHAMGRQLKAYPIFDSAVRKADRVLKHFGATWSLYGW